MYQPLTDQQWQQLEPLFPKPAKRGRGKPHASWRTVVNSILLVLLSGVKWGSIPVSPAYATKSVAHRWFAIWDKEGFLEKLLKKYQEMMAQQVAVNVPPRRNRGKKKAEVVAPHLEVEAEYDEDLIPTDEYAPAAVHI